MGMGSMDDSMVCPEDVVNEFTWAVRADIGRETGANVNLGAAVPGQGGARYFSIGGSLEAITKAKFQIRAWLDVNLVGTAFTPRQASVGAPFAPLAPTLQMGIPAAPAPLTVPPAALGAPMTPFLPTSVVQPMDTSFATLGPPGVLPATSPPILTPAFAFQAPTSTMSAEQWDEL
jgi:hypothetical protein